MELGKIVQESWWAISNFPVLLRGGGLPTLDLFYTTLKSPFVMLRQNPETKKRYTFPEVILDKRRGLSRRTVYFLTRSFTAGIGLENLIEQVIRNQTEGYTSTLDHLGEGFIHDTDYGTNAWAFLKLTLDGKIEEAERQYIRMMDKVAERMNQFGTSRQCPTVSLKPSNFLIKYRQQDGKLTIPDEELQRSYATIERIARYAKQKGVNITIDMENTDLTDFTLDSCVKLLKSGLDNVGIALQTRLHRTLGDIYRLKTELDDDFHRVRVRLCIGIYNVEDEGIALHDIKGRERMKNRMVDYARFILENGGYVEFATHDVETIKRFYREVIIPDGYTRDKYELQCLLGVPIRKELERITNGDFFKENFHAYQFYNQKAKDVLNELREQGAVVRLYTPYAEEQHDAEEYGRRRVRKSLAIFWSAFRRFHKIYWNSLHAAVDDYKKE